MIKLKMEYKIKCKRCGVDVECVSLYARCKKKYCEVCRKIVNRENIRKAYWKKPEYYREYRKQKLKEKKDKEVLDGRLG